MITSRADRTKLHEFELPWLSGAVVRMGRERGVATVPGSSFFSRPEPGRHLVRFVFCKTDDLLHEAAARLLGGGHRDAKDVQR